MMKNVPFADPFAEADNLAPDTEPSERRMSGPKTALQWPPDCLWPFVDGGRDGES
jgi:hypothetical protein